ncbi:MAG TPA: alcohol dehydrogenase catalytic domain-containing protein [Umezawaea sp.]|nr:alcohol dehydrogenase catalytic domain-containing protein [Umezawaea sp.]
MREAVVTKLGAPLEIRDVPVREPGAGQVRVRIEASGICHTDIHAARGDQVNVSSASSRAMRRCADASSSASTLGTPSLTPASTRAWAFHRNSVAGETGVSGDLDEGLTTTQSHTDLTAHRRGVLHGHGDLLMITLPQLSQPWISSQGPTCFKRLSTRDNLVTKHH